MTWRDLVSSAIALAMVLAHASFAYGTRLPLLSSAWDASAVELATWHVLSIGPDQ